MYVLEGLNTFRREDMGILPGLPSVGDGLAPLGRAVIHGSRFQKNGTTKKGTLKSP